MIIGNASSREITRHFGNLTPAKVIAGGFPSMAKLKKEHGIERIENVLTWLIMESSKYFADSIAPNVAEDTAVDILAKYYYLTLEDCYCVFDEIKQSKVYGKFTPNHVFKSFAEYDEKRMGIVEDLSYNEHVATKESRAAPESLKQVVNENAKSNKRISNFTTPNKLIHEPFNKIKR